MKTLLTLGIIALMCSCSRREIPTNMETINNLEDMREWVEWDMSQGRLDSVSAHSYFTVIDASIFNLNK